MLSEHDLKSEKKEPSTFNGSPSDSGTFQQIDVLLNFLSELETCSEHVDPASHQLVVNQLLETSRNYLESLLEEEKYLRLAEESKYKTLRLLIQLQGLVDVLNKHHVLEISTPEFSKTDGDQSSILSRLLTELVDWSKDSISTDNSTSSNNHSYETADQTRISNSLESIDSVPQKRPNRSSPIIRVNMFGPFEFRINDSPVSDFPNSKGKQLLKYLIIQRRRVTLKEELMELLWPGYDSISARNNLNVVVYGLRQSTKRHLGETSLILFKDGGYHLNPDLELIADFELFELSYQGALKTLHPDRSEETIEKLQTAEKLYRSSFLEEDIYCSWTNELRERYQRMHLDILEALDHAYEQSLDTSARVAVNQKILATDPCNEVAHEHLMRCYDNLGQRHLALRQFREAEQSLKEELDIEPSEQLRQVYEEIKKQQIAAFT